MYSPTFKCLAVLLISCVAVFPLYAQVRDSSAIASPVNTAPVHDAVSPAVATSSKNTSSETPNPDPDSNPEEVRLNASYSSFPGSTLSSPVGVDSREPDEAVQIKDYLQGMSDGKRGSRGKPYWMLAGLSGTGLCICFSVAGIGLALAVPNYPPPPAEMLIGKSSKYIEGYFEGYTAKSRWKNAGWAAFGCLIAVIIDVALNYPLTFGNIYFEMDSID